MLDSSLIFPILLLVLITVVGYRFALVLAEGALSRPDRERQMTRRDALILTVIVAAYALRAFCGLGDMTAPESFCHFPESGSQVVLELEEDRTVEQLLYYTGLKTGTYTVSVSDDGVYWTDIGTLEQKHSMLFSWREGELAPFETRYLRLTSDKELYLGELEVRDGDGESIPLKAVSGEAEKLLDEPDIVPESRTCLNGTYFDEIYHARTAYENVVNVYPYEISHPPLGKLIISIGIRLFGMNPFGWRCMGTLTGVLMLPVLYLLLKRLFGNTATAGCGTLIFAFDFMHFVQTRIATIDSYAVFFILLMYYFMYRFVTEGKLRHLALSGISFGLGAASKWTCIYAGAGLALIWLIYWVLRFRREKEFRPLAENILFCLLFFVLIPGAIYYASYYPYGKAIGLEGIGMYFKPEYARLVWDNQVSMLTYHVGVDATHPYSSRWYQWIFDARPILYYLDYGADGTKSAIAAFVSPLLCWGGLFAMVAMGYLALRKRDARAGFILIGYLAQLVPWMFVSRITFEYHYFACTVFLTLALCYALDGIRRCDRWGKWPMYVCTAVSLGLFLLFMPVLTGTWADASWTGLFLKWFPSWPV